MAQVSEKLRKQLMEQKKEMATGGLLISNKEWTKGRVRLLPCNDEIPGHRVVSYYCESLQGDRKGTTSPVTFGLPCPIEAAFRKLKGEDKEVRDRAYNYCRTSTEYWVPVIVRGDEGTPDAPKVRIFPMKKSVYSKVQSFMVDEDIGEDITDSKEGRDLLIKKEGQNKTTEWHADKLDKTPLHPKKEMRAAIIQAGKELDVREHFFSVDYDVLAKIYEGLTGEKMPKSYLEAAKKQGAVKPKKEREEDASDDSDEGGEEEAAPEIKKGSRVTFENEGEEHEGTVKKITGDTARVEDEEGEEWEVQVENLTLASDEDDDENSDDEEDDDAEDGDDDSEESSDDDEDDADDEDADDDEDDAEEGDDDEDEDDDSDDDAEEDDDEDSDDEDDDEAEEAAPAVSRKGKPAAKPAKAEKASKPAKGKKDEDDDEPPARQTVSRKPAKAGKASDKIRKAGKK